MLFPTPRQVPHALLTRPPLSSASIGRILFPRILVRLACVKHAASVHPEPGSNSQSMVFKRAFRPAQTLIEASLLLGIVSRAFQTIACLERTSCPFLVLRVSLHCLIYKVHAADRRDFYTTTLPPSCQVPFFASGTCHGPPHGGAPTSDRRRSPAPAAKRSALRSRARLYYHPLPSLVNTFFRVFATFFLRRKASLQRGHLPTEISVASPRKL